MSPNELLRGFTELSNISAARGLDVFADNLFLHIWSVYESAPED